MAIAQTLFKPDPHRLINTLPELADSLVSGLDMVRNGSQGVRMAGFFDNDCKLNPANYTVNTKPSAAN